MRYALISDIHGNLPALDAVLADIRGRPDVDVIFHLGDLVGYAPWPDEIVARIQRECVSGVAGNYDSTVATNYKNCGCRYEDPGQERLSHMSYKWTIEHTSSKTKSFLATLPFRIDLKPRGGHVAGPRLTLVHAHTSNNLIYVDEGRSDDFLSKMADTAGLATDDVIAFGHTHKPWHREVNGVHFVNTGSVGRPKDGNWRAGYAIVDAGGRRTTVEFVRVEYDVEAAVTAIIASDLPDEFAAFLRSGGVPPEHADG